MTTMLKNILAFVLLLIVIPAYPQLFNGGVEVGVSASQVDGDCSGGYHKFGLTGGIYADLVLSKKSSLRSGIYLVDKGAHSGAKEQYFKLQLSEAEIPLWYNYSYSDKLAFSAGVSAAYIYKAYYDAGVYLPFEDLNISRWDYTFYWAIKMKVYKQLYFKLSNSYGIVPISRPVTGDCWRQSVYLNWLSPSPYCNCWWTNTVRVSFELNLF